MDGGGKAAEPRRVPAAVAAVEYKSRVATATPGLRGMPTLPPYADRHPAPPSDRSKMTPRVLTHPLGTGVRRPNAAKENQRYAAKTMAAGECLSRPRAARQ